MSKKLFIVMALVAAMGCGARMEVAKDKFLAQVDSLLGEVEVKKKEAEIGLRNVSASVDSLTKAKIEAKVRLRQISERSTELDSKITEADTFLRKLGDHMKAGLDVTISGKTFTQSQLKEMADSALPLRQRLAGEAEVYRESKKRLESTVALLERKEREGKDRVRLLAAHIDEIDAKCVALESMRDASRLSGVAESPAFGNVEKQIHDLSTKIDVELAFQEEKAKESIGMDVDTLDNMIRQTSTSDDTLKEIERLTGKL